VPTRAVNYDALRNALEAAVQKRLMSEVPFGVLLSGGLDSSLIASIAQRFFIYLFFIYIFNFLNFLFHLLINKKGCNTRTRRILKTKGTKVVRDRIAGFT
jgi:hypothetical protein